MCTSAGLFGLGLCRIRGHKPSGCPGNFTDAQRISPETADVIAKVILVYLILGSYALLAWDWRQCRKSVALGQTKLDTAITVDP